MKAIRGLGEEGIVHVRPGREADPAAPLGDAEVVHGHHPLHRATEPLGQDGEDPVVHIGAGEGHVPQAGGLEQPHVCLQPGLQEAAPVLEVAAVIGQPQALELVLAQQGARVAVHAAPLGAKQVHAPQRLVAHSLLIPLDEALQRTFAANDGALEGGDGLGDPIQGDGLVAEGGGKGGRVVAACPQPRQQFVVIEGHLHRVADGMERLLLQGGDPSVPELAAAVTGIEDGRCIAGPLLPQMADRDAQAIAPAFLRIVTAGAADVAGLG